MEEGKRERKVERESRPVILECDHVTDSLIFEKWGGTLYTTVSDWKDFTTK